MSKAATPTKPMKIELKPIEWLKPYEKNAKKHPEEQVDRLAKTISRLGWDQPIVAWTDGTIIKGHGRRLAALKLGMTTVPVLVRSDLTKDEADAARIADNAVVGQSFDTRMIQEELQRLMASDATLSADDLGLSEKDRKLLLEKLDDPEFDALMQDTSAEVEKQKDEDAASIVAVDAEQIKLAEAFGFKTVSREEARLIGRMMNHAQDNTGKSDPQQAFLAWIAQEIAS